MQIRPPAPFTAVRPAARSAWKDVAGACLLGAAVLTGPMAGQGAPLQPAPTVSVETLQVREIAPSATDPAIRQARGPHLAVVDPSVPSNGLLLISLGGTNSVPRDLLAFDRVAAGEGFAALALDYPNSVITTACQSSPQDDPCTRFRQEIQTGDPVSDLVQVAPQNSLEHRLEALLRYQARVDPSHYGQFLDANGPVWSKIVVVGHSQGSGHAGYLAKKHPLRAVIMLAGPQDTTAAGPASWITDPSSTPPERYYSFLHEDDFFGSQNQLALSRLLREEPGRAPDAAHGPIVVTHAPVKDPHMSVIDPEFRSVWVDLLERAQS